MLGLLDIDLTAGFRAAWDVVMGQFVEFFEFMKTVKLFGVSVLWWFVGFVILELIFTAVFVLFNAGGDD